MAVTIKQKPHIDEFLVDCNYDGVPCNHVIEFGGEALQRPQDSLDALRHYAITNFCSDTGSEMYAEEYTFDCPNN